MITNREKGRPKVIVEDHPCWQSAISVWWENHKLTILNKTQRIVELPHSPNQTRIRLKIEFLEFDPNKISTSFFKDWGKFWNRESSLGNDFYES